MNIDSENELRSPEKIDTMIRVTDPINWIGLIAIGVLCLAIIAWTVLGSFTERVEGYGLILDSAGIGKVSHMAEGKISKVHVRKGDTIHKWDLIATLDNIEEADVRVSQYDMNTAENSADFTRKRYSYDAKNYHQVLEDNIYSDYDGIVDEIYIKEGSLISKGDTICTIRITQGRDDLSGVFYIPLENGKRVEKDMSIQLAPNGVDTSQTGNLVAVVKEVTVYPSTIEKMSMETGNPQLAQYIMNKNKGASIEVSFELVEDPDSDSGYLWTSNLGRNKKVTPGTFCTGFIVIDRRPPIEKVFYKFSQWLRSN